MNTPTNEQINKLPAWAQSHIKDLCRQREEAIRALNNFVDKSTVSPISYEKHPCTGEQPGPSFKKVYVQTDRVNFHHAGVTLSVYLAKKHDRQRHYGIELQWSGSHRTQRVALVPTSFQMASLVAKENL